MYRQTWCSGARGERTSVDVSLDLNVLPALIWSDEVEGNVDVGPHGERVRDAQQPRVDRGRGLDLERRDDPLR